MNTRPVWSYVQARLQARHGDRLDDAAWRILESAKSFDHFLERTRRTSLHRFTDLIDGRMPSHTVERVLRAAWRDYVAEVATWAPPSWRSAILWVAHLPDLPVLDALFKGNAPDWAREDPVFAGLARGHSPDDVELAPLSPAATGGETLGAQWVTHWRALWPSLSDSDRRGLDKLVGVVATYFGSLARAGLKDSSVSYRRGLERKATRIFRNFAGTPAALFSHLTLVALDLARLRGGLARRRHFDPGHFGKAA